VTSGLRLRTLRGAGDRSLGMTDAGDAIPAVDELLGVGHDDSSSSEPSTQGTLALGDDISAGTGPRTFDKPDDSPVPAENHQPDCALCGLKAHMWSGVSDWMDEFGRWIGWCSKECQRRWLTGDRLAHRRGTGA
jgi:hypothetical protein